MAMRQRAVLILTILLGAVWATGVSPAAAQTPPPPDVEVPKEKKPKPEKPDVPKGPKDPPAPPEEPEPPPPPPPPTPPDSPSPPEPTPPDAEAPPTDDGGAGSGGGTSDGGSGGGPRASELGTDRSGLSFGQAVESRAREDVSRTIGPAASPGPGDTGTAIESPTGPSLASFEWSETATAPAEPTRAAAVEADRVGVGGLPVAVLVAGLVLVSVGLAVGAGRIRRAGPWHPPGSRPERT
jgi:type IV secretory pathway VirB10-like protein